MEKAGNFARERSVSVWIALRERPRQFLVLTGLHVVELDDLLTVFAPARKRQQFPTHCEQPTAVLASSDVKLFFSPHVPESHALHEYQAAGFGNAQARVNQSTTALLGILHQILARRGLLPVRSGVELVQRLSAHPAPVFIYGGIERGVLRNIDHDAQSKEYSAKKSTSPTL